MKMLTDFGSVSRYKLNSHKSQLLTLNYTTSQQFRDKYAIREVDSMKYLGVWLPKDLTRLASENYDPLLSNIRQDLDSWNLLPFLGLIQCVEIVKINLLPRVLYSFQSLPVEISDTKFAEWDKWISRFLWHGKKPRVRYKNLQVPRDKGGFALPCLKTYYQAAQIKPLYATQITQQYGSGLNANIRLRFPCRLLLEIAT